MSARRKKDENQQLQQQKPEYSRGDFHDSGSLNLFSCGIFASQRINKKKRKRKKVERDKMHTLTSGAGTQRQNKLLQGPRHH